MTLAQLATLLEDEVPREVLSLPEELAMLGSMRMT
jgi:hypothetical protein